MNKKLGNFASPEQYAPCDDNVVFENSLDALEVFRIKFPGVKGRVRLLHMNTQTFAPQYQNILLWGYIEKSSNKLIGSMPVFTPYDIQTLRKLVVRECFVISDDSYFHWMNETYAIILTDKQEYIIKKSKMILDSRDIVNIMTTFYNRIGITTALPVEAYSPATDEFICSCWQMNEEDEPPFIKCISTDDEEKLAPYNNQPVRTFLIKPNETTTIGGKNYILRQSSPDSYYFEKFFEILNTSTKEYIKLNGRNHITVPQFKFKSENHEKIIPFKPETK